MKLYNINNYKRGWFIGSGFDPTLLSINVEVGYQKYKRGTVHPSHYHKLCDEVNLIISGSCLFEKLNGDIEEIVATPGDIVYVEKFEIIRFIALRDCSLVVIKSNSDKNDKYII